VDTVAADLPPWDGTNESRRAWKRRIAQLGKDAAFHVLEPHISSLLNEIDDTSVGSSNQSQRYVTPAARASLARGALQELKAGAAEEHCLGLQSDYSILDGLRPRARHILEAALQLVVAMCARSQFEKQVMTCLDALSSVDLQLVERVRRSFPLPSDPDAG